MTVRFAKLIADVGRNAWFDAARAQTDQHQSKCELCSLPDCHSPGGGHAGQCQVAQAVNEGKRQDRPIFADPPVGDNRAEDRKEIDAEDEIMRVHVRFVRSHRREHARLVQNVVRHENGQHRFHSVIGKAFGRFVADDVGHSRRHASEVGRRS